MVLIPGCGSDSPKDFVAVVGKKKITVDEFQKKMSIRKKSFSNSEKKELLDEMVTFEVLYASAVKAGYDKKPKLMEAFRRMVTQKFIRDKLDPLVMQLTVSENDINEYYKEHIQEFSTSPMIRAAIIKIEVPTRVSTEKKEFYKQKAKEARKEALMLSSHVRSFGAVAIKFSDDQSSRYRGGDTGWIKTNSTRNKWENKVMETLVSLEPGVTSPIITGEKGFYLVKVIERKETTIKPLAKVKHMINHQILTKKKKMVKEEFYATLKKDISVSVDDAKLAILHPSGNKTDDQTPPELPKQ